MRWNGEGGIDEGNEGEGLGEKRGPIKGRMRNMKVGRENELNPFLTTNKQKVALYRAISISVSLTILSSSPLPSLSLSLSHYPTLKVAMMSHVTARVLLYLSRSVTLHSLIL